MCQLFWICDYINGPDPVSVHIDRKDGMRLSVEVVHKTRLAIDLRKFAN